MNIHELADMELRIGRMGQRVDALWKFYHQPGKHPQKRHGRKQNIPSGGSNRGSIALDRMQFKLFGDAQEWTKENYGDWLERLRGEDALALKRFTDSSTVLNQFVRGDLRRDPGEIPLASPKLLDKLQEQQNILDRIIKEVPEVPEDIVVHRGMHTSRFKAPSIANMIGNTVFDKGYVSTSMLGSVAEDFSHGGFPDAEPVIFRVLVPQGAKGVPLNTIRIGEAEFTLPRNSKFKILNAFKDPTKTRFDAELIE